MPRKAKMDTREMRKAEVGHCIGPYDGVSMSIKRIVMVPRDGGLREVLKLARLPDDDDWASVAWRKRVYWEFEKRKKDGSDVRLVVRLARKREHREELLPSYSGE